MTKTNFAEILDAVFLSMSRLGSSASVFSTEGSSTVQPKSEDVPGALAAVEEQPATPISPYPDSQ